MSHKTGLKFKDLGLVQIFQKAAKNLPSGVDNCPKIEKNGIVIGCSACIQQQIIHPNRKSEPSEHWAFARIASKAAWTQTP